MHTILSFFPFYKKSPTAIPIIKQFLIYACGSLFLKTISLVIVPLNLRKLIPSDYGTLSLILSFTSIASTLIGLGLRQVVSLEYFHCASNLKKHDLLNAIISIYLIFAVPVLSLLYMCRTSIMHTIFFDAISSNTFLWILIIVFLTFFSDLFYQIMQYNQLVYRVTCIQIGIALFITVLTIVFVWIYNLNYQGIILAQLIGYCISSTITLIACLEHGLITRLTFDHIITKIKTYLPYGFPFIPRILFSWVLLASDKWILGYYCSMQDVGIYAVADLFAQVLYSLIIIPWESAYIPYIMNEYKHNKSNIATIENNNQKTMYRATAFLFFVISIGFFISKKLLCFLLPPSYTQAINHILILALGQLFLLASNFASTLLQFYKRTYVLLFVLTIPALCNVGLNFLLIPYLGVYGATVSTFISFTLYWGITLYMNHRTRVMYWHRDCQAHIPLLVSNQTHPLS